MISIKKLSPPDLNSYQIHDGFKWCIKSSTLDAKYKVKDLIKQKISDQADILLAIEENTIIGFAVIIDWKILPNSKYLDAIEVAEPYRGKGIGSEMMKKLLDEWDTLVALMLTSEPGHEKKLYGFYQKFGFKVITDEMIEPPILVRIPKNDEKLKNWIEYISKISDKYSYKMYETRTTLKIWGRRFAPWLKFSNDIYPFLLKEMKSMFISN